MKNETGTLRPEVFYDQLADPKTTDVFTALEGLKKVLEIDGGLADFLVVNNAIVARQSTEESERDEKQVGRRIVGLLSQYPWLRGPGQQEITARDMNIWAGNHLFDNYPGMFGVTEAEAHSFRAMMENSFGTPEHEQFCQEIGLPVTS